MEIAHIAGPYRAATESGIQENIERAEAYAIKYWLRGYGVLCPHKNSSHLDGIVPDKNFLDADSEFIKRCVDIMVMAPGGINQRGQ